jgi:glutamate dehydrogenase
MSGDVFGNAMLLSRKIRLIAAFDHRDVFLDPAPTDLEAAWSERKRLFDQPGSRWRDYDPTLLSAGGGVFSRADKSVPLSAEVRALTGLARDAVTPAELISALLKAETELLFFGGIGTFIKARAESHTDAADKSNDGLRVNAEDVRAKVIGEGANLGVTQAGRIAFARKGGRLNTDAIDNSAGVDTSDHEVNIKILLGDATRSGALKPDDRDPLLAAMTDDIARHVLRHNYDQTLALSLSEATAPSDLDAHERFVQRLETSGRLSRSVETLPTPDAFAELRTRGLGLIRPELAKIVAYAKLDLKEALVASAAPDDPAFEEVLLNYFPPQLRKFEAQMRRHRLRREIIATALADDIVNVGGPTFIDRARDTVQAMAPTITLSFAAARRLFAIDDLRARIDALDNKAAAPAQYASHLEIAATLRRLTIALAKRRLGVNALTERYATPIAQQKQEIGRVWTPVEREASERRTRALIEAGAPDALAMDISLLGRLISAIDIADLAAERDWPLDATAALYRALGGAFGIDTLRASANDIVLGQHWERLALRRTLDQLGDDQRGFAESAMTFASPPAGLADAAWGARTAEAWLSHLGEADNAAQDSIGELRASGSWTFAKVVLAAASLRALATHLSRKP